MIDIDTLTKNDIGRFVIWRDRDQGILTSWNEQYIFVKFRGPNGEACRPEDVSFLTYIGISTTFKLDEIIDIKYKIHEL